MEVEAEDGFEAAENITIGNTILMDKDFIAIVGKYELLNYSGSHCDDDDDDDDDSG